MSSTDQRGSRPLGYPARALRDGAVVAETTAAIRVDSDDSPPVLWFPRADVPGELDVTAGEGDLAGHVCFDPKATSLEIVDVRDGDDDRDVTVKRFPNWGDAADLIKALDVRTDDQGHWVGTPRGSWRRSVVEGSQLLGQAIVAAGRHTPGRRAVYASMTFPRAGNAALPVPIELEEVQGGRTFSTFVARAVQDGRTCAVGTLLCGTTSEDLIRHEVSAPDVVGPYDAPPFDMSVTGRDLRIVDNAYTGDPDAPVGPAVLDAWVRFREVPDEQCLHAALLAQFTGHMSIVTALRPHAGIGQNQAHVTISTAISAITLSIHADIRADQWLLYHHESTFAGDGMTHSECRVFDEARNLVASFSVEAMVRPFANPAQGDAKTAL